MNFAKTSLWVGLSTIVKIISSFLVNKFVAVFLGTTGMAMIGQFKDFLKIIMSISNLGIQQGVVKYSAEFSTNKDELKSLISTSFLVSLIASVFIGIILIVLNKIISIYVFNNPQYSEIILILAFTISFFTLNTLLISIVNGLSNIKLFVLINIISSLLGLILTILLIYFFKLKGSLIALTINESIFFILTIVLLYKQEWFNIQYFNRGLNKKWIQALSKYSLMFIVAAISMPVSLFLTRNLIGENLSWDIAGQWEALWRMSGIFIMVLTTSFGVYLIPSLSKKEGNELRLEIFHIWKIVIPVSIVIALVIYFIREHVIFILFSAEFLPIKELFGLQLMGDILKLSSWVLGSLVVAKANVNFFIITEALFALLFFALNYIMLPIWGIKGIAISHLITYLIHLIVMNIYFYKILWKR